MSPTDWRHGFALQGIMQGDRPDVMGLEEPVISYLLPEGHTNSVGGEAKASLPMPYYVAESALIGFASHPSPGSIRCYRSS